MTKCRTARRSRLRRPGDVVKSSRLFYEPQRINLQRNNKQSNRLKWMWKHPGGLQSWQPSKKDVIKKTTCGGEPCVSDGESLARYVCNSKLSEASWERSSRLRISPKILPHARPWGPNLEMKDNMDHIFTIHSLFKVCDAEPSSKAGARFQASQIDPLKIKRQRKNSQSQKFGKCLFAIKSSFYVSLTWDSCCENPPRCKSRTIQPAICNGTPRPQWSSLKVLCRLSAPSSLINLQFLVVALKSLWENSLWKFHQAFFWHSLWFCCARIITGNYVKNCIMLKWTTVKVEAAEGRRGALMGCYWCCVWKQQMNGRLPGSRCSTSSGLENIHNK